VRKSCSHSDGWDAASETETQAEFGGKAANFAKEKRQARQQKVMHVTFNIPGPFANSPTSGALCEW
jgi:hypothetical protein